MTGGVITRVWIDESENECTGCGACEVACAAGFAVADRVDLRAGAPTAPPEELWEAAEACPAGVIALEFDGSGRRDFPAQVRPV